jgi:hypothetical protein
MLEFCTPPQKYNTVKHAVTSITQSPVLKGQLFLVVIEHDI